MFVSSLKKVFTTKFYFKVVGVTEYTNNINNEKSQKSRSQYLI